MRFLSCVQKARRKFESKRAVNKGIQAYAARYQKYSFSGTQCRDERQYEAVITRWYHTIEKGLAYENFRPGFGKSNLSALMASMENYIKAGYNTDTFFFQTALSTIEQYIQKNRRYGAETSELEKKINEMNLAEFKLLGGGGTISFTPHTAESVQQLGYKEFVKSRHSMRHFSDNPLDIEQVKKAVTLAQCTPSACNRQGWKSRIIEDKILLANLLENQNGNEGFGQEFDKLLLITADIRCFNRERELFQAFIDGGMYAQSILNALNYYHIASVPLSASLTEVQESNVRKLLNLHEAEVLIMFVGIGNYPDGVCLTTKSERRPAEIIVL